MAANAQPRVDSATKFVNASCEEVYEAFLTSEAVAVWLPPAGMTASVDVYEPRPGGRFRITLTYAAPHGKGKSSLDTDVVEGEFLSIAPGERVVQAIKFDADDPSLDGTMTMTWNLTPVSGGTQVTIRCHNVPPGISPEDHQQGFTSTLANLARYVEGRH